MNNKKIIGLLVIIGIVALGYLILNPTKQNPPQNNMQFIQSGLQTNTEISLIPLEEVVSGGPSKDGIPALSNSKFTSSTEATNVPEDSLGILVTSENEVRFYPYTVLVWHELVNDTLDDVPLVISFCPLCGSAIVYERTLNGVMYEFGVSGKLWQSNLLMYDTATESLWSQIEGRAVVGGLKPPFFDASSTGHYPLYKYNSARS